MLKNNIPSISSSIHKAEYSKDLITYNPARDYQLTAAQQAHDYYNSGNRSKQFEYKLGDIKFKLLPFDTSNKHFIMLKKDGTWGYLKYLQPRYELRTAITPINVDVVYIKEIITIKPGEQYYYDLLEKNIVLNKIFYTPNYTRHICEDVFY